MLQWITGPWRVERFVIRSPLSARAAGAALRDGLAGSSYWSGKQRAAGPLFVYGVVDGERVRVTAARKLVRNSFRPVLRGELTAAGAGARLDCRLGWPVGVRIFAVVWLVPVLGVFVGAAGRLLSGAPGAAASATVMLVAAAFAAFFVGLLAVGRRISRDEVDHLRSWLVGRLQADPADARAWEA